MKLLKFYYRIKDLFRFYMIEKPRYILFKIKDYDRISKDYSHILDFVTDGKMSKTNYDLNTIFAVINDTQSESYYSVVKDDIKIIISDGGTIDDIKKYINEL